MPKSRRLLVVAFCALTVFVLAGTACAPAPSRRPVKAGPVDAGPGSLESVRRQLEGRWELVSFETVTPAGQSRTVAASGLLTYDAYGNVTLQGQLLDEADRKAYGDAPAVLNISGRAVIDVASGSFRIVDATSDRPVEAADSLKTVSLDKVRYYAFEGDLLKTIVKDAGGRTTATATWKRLPK